MLYRGGLLNGFDEDDVVALMKMGFAVGRIFTVVLGVIVVCSILKEKERVDLKKALKVYEAKESPAVKLSLLSPRLYELDRADRPTQYELVGIKRFLNKKSRRAEVWSLPSGEYVCSNIVYKGTTGYTEYPDGGGYTVTDTKKTSHRLYDVNPKYKKDAAYLCATMCLVDGVSNKSILGFVEDIKNKYPEEFKRTKVKLLGKSLEGMGFDEEGCEEGCSKKSVGEACKATNEGSCGTEEGCLKKKC